MTAVTIHQKGAIPVVPTTLLDRAISLVSPEAGLRRMHARAQLALAGQYLGARRDRRPTQEWIPREGSPNDDLLGDLPMLRARSTDLERNEPLATGAVAGQLTAVIGPGLQLNPRIDRALLGLSDEEADAWELQASRLWSAHANTYSWDAAGKASFAEQTDQVLWGALVKGDILAVRRYQPRAGRLFGLAVQLIEADRISSPNGRDTDRIIAGVEFNPNTGETIAYHVASEYPGNRLRRAPVTWARIPRFDERGEPLALLMGDHLRPDSLRSAPWLAAVIEPLKQLGTYTHAELTAAVISAFFTVFVKSPLDTSGEGGAEGPWSASALQPSTAGNPPSSSSDLKLGAGMIADLAPGEEIQIANPGRPNAQFDPFWMSMVQQIAVGLGMPAEIILQRFNASYSASRAAMVQAWRVYGKRRARLAAWWCHPSYQWLLTEAVARGYLNAPGFFADPLRRAAWCGADWTGPTMPQLDPVKEANGAILRMGATLTTREQETASLTGGNWERQFAQVKKERRMLEEAGIAVPSAAPADDEQEEAA
jgi:lambda family phage portal protein